MRSPEKSSSIVLYILGEFLTRTGNYGLIGDIEELYNIYCIEKGRLRTYIWLWSQIIKMIPMIVSTQTSKNVSMIKNYMKISFRSILRNKVYSLINIFGLSLGLSCCVMIILYVQYEMSYDSFHENADDIYRVSHYIQYADGGEYDSHVYLASLGPSLLDEFPEIEYAVRFHKPFSGYLSSENKRFLEYNISYADAEFFGLFSFDLITGGKDQALAEPFSIVLTESLASKYFGDVDPTGKVILLNNETVLTVTGIAKDPPVNSDLKFSALISFSTLYKLPGLYLGWDGGNRYITYCKMKNNVTAADLEAKLPEFLKRHTPFYSDDVSQKLYLQPLRDIHLHVDGYSGNVYLFSSVALIIMLIACINSMNMSTARSSKRAKEIGIRKVSGARRAALIKQFMGESFIMSFTGFLAGMLLLLLLLPVFAEFSGRELTIIQLLNPSIFLALILLLLFVSIISGSYPALFMSSFKPVDIIEGKLLKRTKSRISLKSTLVIFQFAVSIGLIIFTSFVYLQLNHIRNSKLGFNRESILVVPLIGKDVQRKYDIIKHEFNSLSEVESTCVSSDYPGRGLATNGYIPEGIEEPMQIHILEVCYDYLDMMGLKTVRGRKFSEQYSTDQTACLINEALVRKLGWNDPIGKIINRNIDFTVIGVVEDYNFAPLYEEIEPLIITPKRHDRGFEFISIKINSRDISGAMRLIERRWKSVTDSANFEYFFLDDLIDTVYKDEKKFGDIFRTFAALTLLIACLGLFGLVSFMVEQNVKEIGIRKALGASVPEIFLLITKSYSFWILTANIISWPIAWYTLEKWLQDFAYRVEINLSIFLLCGAVCFLTAMISVGYLSIKAAGSDPVNSLRYE